MRKLPPLIAVRVFEAAARHENFTRAAQELGVTQSGVSHHVKLLEAQLGIQLFVRSGRRVALSEAGGRLAGKLTKCFDGIAAAFEDLAGDDDSLLTISTIHSVGANWLAPRLSEFREVSPSISVQINSSDRLVDFANEDVDVALRSGEGPWRGTRQHFLFHWHATPLCTPEFQDRNRIRQPADLLNVERISPDDPLWGAWFEMSGINFKMGAARGMRFDTQIADGQAVLAGRGVGMLTPPLWEREIAAGRLVRPFALDVFERDALWLVYPERNRNKPKVKRFRDWLLARLDRSVDSTCRGS